MMSMFTNEWKNAMERDGIIVDARGTLCPTPVIKTKKAFEDNPEQLIVTLVDNEVSQQNVEKFAKTKGYIVECFQEGLDYTIMMFPKEMLKADTLLEGVFEAKPNELRRTEIIEDRASEKGITVKAGAPVALDIKTPLLEDFPFPLVSNTEASRSKVIILTKDWIGNGSEELGRNLMKTFLFSLSEAEQLPKKLILLNGAVRMVGPASPHLEVLASLQEKGVILESCGICLDYYGLKEVVQVGNITNMFVIVEALTKEAAVVL